MGAALRDYLVKAQNFCFIPCGNVRPFLVQIRLGSPALRQKALRERSPLWNIFLVKGTSKSLRSA
jgi:hypothetical protein